MLRYITGSVALEEHGSRSADKAHSNYEVNFSFGYQNWCAQKDLEHEGLHHHCIYTIEPGNLTPENNSPNESYYNNNTQISGRGGG